MMHASESARRALGAIAIAAIGGAAVVGGCKREDARMAAMAQMKRPPATVTVATAVTRDVPVYLDQIGKAAAREAVNVVPQVGGKVIAVHFTEGSDVKKGDLLFDIDARPFQAALAQAEATLAQRRAELAWAQTQWKNVEGMQAQNAISKEEYEQRRITAETAEAQLKAAEAQVSLARLNLEYCKVNSPIDGRTGKVLIDPGNVVKANEGTLVTIQQLHPIYVDFTIPELALQEVRANMATGTLKVEVSVPDARGARMQAAEIAGPTTAPAGAAAGGASAGTGPANGPATGLAMGPATAPSTIPGAAGSPRIGELTFLDNAVQNGTGTIKLRATVPNDDRYLWPGQFVNVRLVLTTRKDAVLIPTVAQQIGQQGPFVYIVRNGEAEDPQTHQKHPATVAEMRMIKPGQRQGSFLVVDSGVQPGEQVVTVGQMMVQDGAPVQVMPPRESSGPPPAGGQRAPTANAASATSAPAAPAPAAPVQANAASAAASPASGGGATDARIAGDDSGAAGRNR